MFFLSKFVCCQFFHFSGSFWQGKKPTIDSMLGGLKVHEIDLRTSRSFLSQYFSGIRKRKRVQTETNSSGLRVADCGAGIGRISFSLFTEFFAKIDLIEPCPQFIETAKSRAVEMGINDRCEFICQPLQTVSFTETTYDVIWAQWVSLIFDSFI
jgi:protein N-terminal methyltransferase